MKSELLKYNDDRNKAMLRMLRSEMKERIVEVINDRMVVPGLVGDKCPYPNLSNYLMKNHNKIDMEFMNLKNNVTEIQL